MTAALDTRIRKIEEKTAGLEQNSALRKSVLIAQPLPEAPAEEWDKYCQAVIDTQMAGIMVINLVPVHPQLKFE